MVVKEDGKKVVEVEIGLQNVGVLRKERGGEKYVKNKRMG